MEQSPYYYLVEPSPGLPAAVAGLIANGFWRAGGQAHLTGVHGKCPLGRCEEWQRS